MPNRCQSVRCGLAIPPPPGGTISDTPTLPEESCIGSAAQTEYADGAAVACCQLFAEIIYVVPAAYAECTHGTLENRGFCL